MSIGNFCRAALRPDAFQIAVLLIAAVRGVSYVTGFLPSSVAEQSLPVPLRVLCLTELAVGALVSLAGRLSDSIQIERNGLTLLAPSALAYGLLIVYVAPHTGALSIVIYLAMSWSCFSRLYTIGRRAKLIEKIRTEGQ